MTTVLDLERRIEESASLLRMIKDRAVRLEQTGLPEGDREAQVAWRWYSAEERKLRALRAALTTMRKRDDR